MSGGREPTVSVILPVFNGGRDALLAIRSILEQSLADWELLVMDDGSTDEALAGMPADERIRILRDGRNLGIATRLNEGVALARGQFIARMDHDDVAHPDRLARQVAFLAANGDVDLLATACVALSADDRIVGQLPLATTHGSICARPWLGFYMAHPSWMGRTEWFRRNPYRVPGPYRCEDQELLLRTFERSRFAALPDALLAYRVREKPRLSTLLGTRSALMREQARHFAAAGQLTRVALSVLAGAARMGTDIFAPILRQVVPMRGVRDWNDDSKRQEWEHLIARLRDADALPAIRLGPLRN